jgi:hypothetical protein
VCANEVHIFPNLLFANSIISLKHVVNLLQILINRHKNFLLQFDNPIYGLFNDAVSITRYVASK